MEQVIAGAKQACCHDFIMASPNGYDTVIGEGVIYRWFVEFRQTAVGWRL